MKQQSSVVSDADMQYRKLLQLTHQGFQNMSVSSGSPGLKGTPNFSRFFIIKSFTEEDVHKAIKYQVWSSTVSGNAILDQAYSEVLECRREAGSKTKEDFENQSEAQAIIARSEAEVYLFFSVNKSRHFCGVARMVSRVDTETKHAHLWKNAHKWPGSIKLQWLWIKDVPNT